MESVEEKMTSTPEAPVSTGQQKTDGSESVEAAVKLARQYFKVTGHPNKTKLIAREIAYHGTSLGALSATGITDLRSPFEPLTPGASHVPATNTYRMPEGVDERYFAEAIAHRIE